jgi:Ca-activated chloride channel family protein
MLRPPGVVMLVVAAFTPAAYVPAQILERPQAPAFKVGVDMVALSVTVTTGARRYLTDLRPEEFVLLEDGVPQDLRLFSKDRVPVALALLLDTSASMADKLPTVQRAAIEFTRRLGPEDVAEVIEFDHRVTVLHDFTRDAADLERAIRWTTAGGSTALYNAVYIALKDLTRQRSTSAVPGPHREAIVVLTDGEDTASLVGFDDLLDQAKRSEIAIYTIGIRSELRAVGRGFGDADYAMRQLAQQTGGRAYFPQATASLDAIYTQIADDLANQYTLGYVSTRAQQDGRWHRVAVQVTRPDAVARTRQGYYAARVTHQ